MENAQYEMNNRRIMKPQRSTDTWGPTEVVSIRLPTRSDCYSTASRSRTLASDNKQKYKFRLFHSAPNLIIQAVKSDQSEYSLLHPRFLELGRLGRQCE